MIASLPASHYRVAYHIGGKRHRLHFNDLEKATSEAEAKAAQLSRSEIDAVQLIALWMPSHTSTVKRASFLMVFP